MDLSSIRDRFWAAVDKTAKTPVRPGLSPCWTWTKGKTKAGYGQLQARKISQQPLLAHRVAWQLEKGEIPLGVHVLHECDNPSCVRPSHLFLGTQTDNVADRVRKGRTASGDRNGARTKRHRNPFVRNGGSGLKGAAHPMAVLSDAQVADILKNCATGQRGMKAKMARKHGVSQAHVGRLVAGKSRRK